MKKTNNKKKHNKPNTKGRNRAMAKGNPSIGNQKRHDYKVANAIAKRAFEAGFFLEPIAIYESMIADRLESRLKDNNIADMDFKPLGDLIAAMKPSEKNQAIKDLVIKIDIWRETRNKALHEIAKREEGNNKTASEKYAECKVIAEEGKRLLAELSKQIKKARNSEQKS